MAIKYFCDRCLSQQLAADSLIQYTRSPSGIRMCYELCNICDKAFVQMFLQPSPKEVGTND